METIIICEKEYSLKELNYSDLIIHFHTGRAVFLGGTGRNKQYGYRTGVKTNLGDVEISEWLSVVQKLIEFKGDTAECMEILSKVKNSMPWLKTEQEQIECALNLFLRKSFSSAKEIKS